MAIRKALSVLAASLVAAAAFAQDEGGEAEAKEDSAEGAEAKKPAAPSAAFSTLPFCRSAEGVAEVKKPGGEWEPVEDGRFYPLGSAYRTGMGGNLVLAFGADSSVRIESNSSFVTRQQPIGVPSRGIVLGSGTLVLTLAENLREGAFFVTAPGFTVQNPAGESRYIYETTGDGDRVTIRCVTGSLAVSGRHFTIPAMRAANEVVIRSSHDYLATILYGTRGDYIVKLDQGIRTTKSIDDEGKEVEKAEAGESEWHLSPATKVMITRSIPAIGERMSVHTMAFDASGERKSEFCFCEGRSEINSGELVAKDKVDGDELARRAAEATETTAADDAGDDSSSSGESSSGGGGSSESSESSDNN